MSTARCRHEQATRSTALREGAFGHATALACRECGHQVELGPFYACPECFGPLEIAYDFPAVTREEIEAGPPQHLALQGAAAGARRTSSRAPTPSPASPGCSRRTTSAASSASTTCGSRTTRPTRPTPSRTGSWPAR